MQRDGRVAALLVLLILLVAALYPALALNRRVAPEVSLKSVPPWRLRWGPNPSPSPLALHAATHLGPRLKLMAEHGLDVAIWNPWIGGGRPGWLVAAREGRAPLAVAAGLLARPEGVWNGFVALTIAASFVCSWTVLRRLGMSSWGAVLGALAYALSGAVVTHWLDWSSSALALGPLALLPALLERPHWSLVAATWTGTLALLLASGPPAGQYLALALTYSLLVDRRRAARHGRWSALAFSLVLVGAMSLPILILGAAGREEGAPASPPALTQAPASLRGLVTPFPAGDPVVADPVADPETTGGQGGAAYLGSFAIVLALLGILGVSGRSRSFWFGVVLTSSALTTLPTSVVGGFVAANRPFGVLAFAVAVLVARGSDLALSRTIGVRRTAVGAGLVALVGLQLAPPAFHRLPYATPEEAAIPAPVDPALCADGSRVVALLAAIPPDAGAALGLADVRAAEFDGEPFYRHLLGSQHRPGVSVEEALSPGFPLLGARWVLEPLPLRVVSAAVFSHVVAAQVVRRAGESTTHTVRYDLLVPTGPCRLGIGGQGGNTGAVLLQQNGRTRVLDVDPSLAYESAFWQWYAVDSEPEAGEALLGMVGAGPFPELLQIAWDCSGLSLRGERDSVRVWELGQAKPFIHLAEEIKTRKGKAGAAAAAVSGGEPSAATATLVEMSPSRIEALVQVAEDSLAVVQVKYRPGLWHAEIDGRPAVTTPAEGVWTAVQVPAGSTRLTLHARLPGVIWLLAGVACIITGLLAVVGRF